MPVRKSFPSCCGLIALLIGLTWCSGATFAAPRDSSADSRHAIQTGEELERSREWLNAIEHYQEAIEKWPNSQELVHGLRRSKFHFAIERRYSDASFSTSLLELSQREALILFEEVLGKVRTYFVHPISSTSFVAHGTESLYLALANECFLEKHLPHADRESVVRMRSKLREEYWNRPVESQQAARHTVEEVCTVARRLLGLDGTAVVLEYVFGGCNALDDYSNCLTPNRLSDLYDNIDGEFVGLGIEMKSEMGKGLLLVNVLPDSPAAEVGILPGDYIVAIDGQDCRNMTTDAAAGLLRGPAGSRVRLQIDSTGEIAVRHAMVVRRAVHVRSIPVAQIIDRRHGIGYIQMTGFQKTTAEELDAALRDLQRQGLKTLIWDLRGNPGGLLTSAVEVLDRFIEDGVLVSTKGRMLDQNWTYSAHRPGTTDVPLVLLVDGDSASASEIVAGAVRDHRRGIIIGRTTFGKWSVQTILPVRGPIGIGPTLDTGLRLTTAKFYSPHGHTWGDIGVEPDIVVDNPTSAMERYRNRARLNFSSDPDIQKALDVARDQFARR